MKKMKLSGATHIIEKGVNLTRPVEQGPMRGKPIPQHLRERVAEWRRAGFDEGEVASRVNQLCER